VTGAISPQRLLIKRKTGLVEIAVFAPGSGDPLIAAQGVVGLNSKLPVRAERNKPH
jgi:hypothetical protein